MNFLLISGPIFLGNPRAGGFCSQIEGAPDFQLQIPLLAFQPPAPSAKKRSQHQFPVFYFAPRTSYFVLLLN